jgi:TDG/mug DNA glycosylase family protein
MMRRPLSRREPWRKLRLTDRIQPGVRVLLVGINPGVRSAQTGHHFAGPSNRFWKLLYESGLVSERIAFADDGRLPEWGLGVTNVIARPSPGIDELRPGEYLEGWRALEAKIDRFRPAIVAFVGVTLYRMLWKTLGAAPAPAIEPGFQHATVHGARIFVLPNPSGRNANFTYAEMLDAFRALRNAMDELAIDAETFERRRPSDNFNARPPGRFQTAGASSAGSTAAAEGKSLPAAGTARRRTPSRPAAARPRRAPRKRAGSR